MLALLGVLCTIVIYLAAKRLYRVAPRVYLSPLVITPAAVIAALQLMDIPYEAYQPGGDWLTDMIGPGTIALAVPLYKNLHVLKKHATAIGVSVFCGAITAILTSVFLSEWLRLDTSLTDSLAPRSATTPIAMAVSQTSGGIPSMTAIFVMATGLLGTVLGPLIVRAFRIRSDIARGVLLGTSAHTAGTTKAFEFGPVSGAVSSIAMILTAFITLCAAPIVLRMIS
ncbi:LrgB family protein [Paenibacillus sp. y28]|uniref:LrgB family protein n=1 Tax=Paenibacillus sp. y28 TaxID=3129110 RepID=UPI0030175775